MINIDDRLIRELSGDQLKLLTIMVSYMNEKRTCWPSIGTLGNDCNWSVPKVHRIKRQLIELKLIKSDPRYKGNDPGQTSNLYTITTTRVQKYTPLSNLTGGPYQECQGGDVKSDRDPPPNLLHEVLVTEALGTEPLTNEVSNTLQKKNSVEIEIRHFYGNREADGEPFFTVGSGKRVDCVIGVSGLVEYLKANKVGLPGNATGELAHRFMQKNNCKPFNNRLHVYHAYQQFIK